MNADMIEGNWEQMKGKLRETWGKLTDEDVDVINGRREQLLGKIQQRYGRSKEDILNEIARFETALRSAD